MLQHRIIGVVLLSILATPIVVSAAFYRPFGGKIIRTEANRITAQEALNYNCFNPQGSITIKPVGLSPREYVTTFFNSTRTTPAIGQQILGLYSPSTAIINCVFQGTPPNTTILNLNKTQFDWGTSIR
jgi:hypothetical protein